MIVAVQLKHNLSNCEREAQNNIFQTSTGFEPRTTAMPEQCSYKLSYEAATGNTSHFLVELKYR